MSRPVAAVLQLALIVPAVLFLLAVVARGVGPLESEPAQTAQAIVTWYSGRVWTLWVLLLVLPIGAFLNLLAAVSNLGRIAGGALGGWFAARVAGNRGDDR